MQRLSYNSRDLKMEIYLFLPISSLKSTSLWNFRIILNLCTMKSKREIRGKLDDSYWSLFFLSTRMPFLQKYLSVKKYCLIYNSSSLRKQSGYLDTSCNFVLSRFLSMVKLSALSGKIMIIISFLQLATVNAPNAHCIH